MNEPEEILKAMYGTDTTYEDGYGRTWCVFCDGRERRVCGEVIFAHEAGCPAARLEAYGQLRGWEVQ